MQPMAGMTTPHDVRTTVLTGAGVLALATITVAGCSHGRQPVLTQQAEAHRLAAHLRVQFTHAADASNRAVMADTDEASGTAAHDAQQATQTVLQDIDALHRVLDDLGDRTEAGQLDRFTARFEEYRKLDETILPLAVENTNIKAQRLSFGPGQEAVNAFRQALEAAVRPLASTQPRGDALAARALAALLEVQVMEARHIAESDEAAMTRMEASMTASEAAARQALEGLKGLRPAPDGSRITAAAGALDRFTAVNAEIVTLSRRNSNVRSLALSLGRKRTVTAECDDLLQQLEDTLAQHHFSATR
ncbi:MAG: hypothetical protein JWL71_4804 [Acidobacteria bacterium]|nr:hypothetical protein [Acidobacteriota bacterium]